MAAAYMSWGASLTQTGALVQATDKYERAYAIFKELDEPRGIAYTLANKAEIMHFQGNLTGARQLYEQALAIHQEGNDRLQVGYVKFRQGELFAAMGDPIAAENSYRSALEIQNDLENAVHAAVTKCGMAELEIHQGNFGEAAKLAETAESTLWNGGKKDEATTAKIIRARALLEWQKLKEAREHATAAEGHSDLSENFRLGLAAEILTARLRAESVDEIATALLDLEATVAKAAAAGFVVDELEARFALALVERKAGRAADARARLEALAAEAEAMGFGLMKQRVEEQLERDSE